MVRWCVALLCQALFFIGLSMTPARADTLVLTSLLWPPYSGQQLAQQGASIAVTRAALKVMGHELKVDFYPWSRAVKLASMPSGDYQGYLPEYYYDTEKFVFSSSIGTSPLGLVEQTSHPISWHYVADLNRYTLGVVKDYVNTDVLDSMIVSGAQAVEAVTSDEHNIKKVAAGRIDAAVIDVNVLQYLLKQKTLQPLADKLQINRQLLANKQLYIAFRNNDEGRRWRDIVDRGLAQIDAEALANDLLYHDDAVTE
ncbi:substrate-binding periplasmic protein [Shewanella putrefaciens]|uniref:substrate-binding periplasmic protein n=1 Tax=Shewanella putrefaciens TaxID=24 RepID=UPI0018E89D97|nr:transporter substrate-binding domain-containing protein [Shewanella putrefaciens]